MQELDGRTLASELHKLVPGATFKVEHAEALLRRYEQCPIPTAQTRGNLNQVVREILQVGSDGKLRGELVILQVLIRTHGLAREYRTAEQLTQIYGFNLDDVLEDSTLPAFDWYMGFALELVNPEKNMKFIIQDVVAPLSDARPGIEYVTGSGAETTETTNRYFIFERRTGRYRPKTLERLQGTMPPPYPTSALATATTQGTGSEDASDSTQLLEVLADINEGGQIDMYLLPSGSHHTAMDVVPEGEQSPSHLFEHYPQWGTENDGGESG